MTLATTRTGDLDDIKPFTPNQETNKLLLWDGTEPVEGYINALARKLIELTDAR